MNDYQAKVLLFLRLITVTLNVALNFPLWMEPKKFSFIASAPLSLLSMSTNSFVLYSDVTEVYDKLLSFCSANRLTVTHNKEKFFSISAKRRSLLFWQNLRMELKIMAVEKKKVEIKVLVYKYGKRKTALENKYRHAMEEYLSKG